jgi:NAD(P)-dependent dehydrogenase (short-subunit alcohol dehydrogenase family)
VIAITGAGRGIGREHALLLASMGARLVINDVGGGTDGEGRDQGPAVALVDEIVGTGGEAVANTDDMADSDGADRLIATAVENFGGLDALINNAGIIRDRMLINMTDDDWDLSVRVNLRATFAPARAAARHWRERSKAGDKVRAAIVNTSSESGVFANAGQSNYAAAKAGVAALTEVWHKELQRYGVRVNGILPRARTRLTENLMPARDENSFDEADPANVSPFVAYLVSDACEFSGQVFVVGGRLVQRAAPWSLDPDWRLEAEGRWDIMDLGEAVEKVGLPTNEGRDTGFVR